MWIDRMRAMLVECHGAIHIRAGEAHGVPFILEMLSARHPTAWMQIPAPTGDSAGDTVALGNRLALAINRALAGDLLPLGMPFEYHVRAIQHYRPTIVPFTLIVQHADHDLDFSTEVVALHGRGIDVVVTSEPDGHTVAGTCVIESGRLELDLDEARDLAPQGTPEAIIVQALAAARYRTGDYLRRLHESLGLPPIEFPAPSTRLYARSDAPREEPELVIEALVREERLQDALELSVLSGSERIVELLPAAGPRYQADGTLSMLRDLLERLPDPVRHDPTVLEWRLVAHQSQLTFPRIADEVRAHLATENDADLRARYAGLLPLEERFREAERALQERITILTTWQYGRLQPDFDEAIRSLLESLRLSEQRRDPLGMVRAASTLAERYLFHGSLFEAATWSAWASDKMIEHRILDGNRRLRIFNVQAFTQLLRGDTHDIAALEREHASLEGILPDMARVFRTTLAAGKLAAGEAQEAAELLRISYDTAPRRQKGRFGYLLVLALLELGHHAEAVRIADEAVTLTHGEPRYYVHFSLLARALVDAVARPERAPKVLRRIIADGELPFETRATAAVALVHVTKRIDDLPEALHQQLQALPEMGLRAISAPSGRLGATYRLLRGETDALVVRLFGTPSVAVKNEPIELPLRLLEVLAVLLLSDRPLRTEELYDRVIPDGDDMKIGTLRTHVTRLRKKGVPISDQPYTLEIDTRFDYREGMEALHQGRIRDALALRRGEFLPESEAPTVVETRQAYDAALHEAALTGSDLDATFDLAERLRDDLLLWEVLVEKLPAGDPRMAIAKSNLRRHAKDFEGDG